MLRKDKRRNRRKRGKDGGRQKVGREERKRGMKEGRNTILTQWAKA